MGAELNMLGVVEVMHHPTNTMPDLNYVTPRKNTAWVPAEGIQDALDHLAALQRKPRLQYIEGLFPAVFAKALRQLDLEIESETPIMAYQAQGFDGQAPPEIVVPPTPSGIYVRRVETTEDQSLWWYVWHSAYYNVTTMGVEPLLVGRDIAKSKLGHQIDFVMTRRFGFPLGAVRVSIHEDTAHIVALVVIKEQRTPQHIHLLQTHAVQAALERGCTLVFAPGDDDLDRSIYRELGFVDIGSMVCYAAKSMNVNGVADDSILDEPILPSH